MKVLYILFCVTICFISCTQDKQPILGDTEFQREINAQYKDATESPLKKKDRKNFMTLDFFTFDSTYVVNAKFKRTPNEKPFKMKTTSDRLPLYVKYGEVRFAIKGDSLQLNVYQNQELIEKEDFENYLFLPFLDQTNGDTSYGGGRYVDIRIPEGDIMIIDFNSAYNPYCAYNEKYSCPIVPRINYLPIKIEAGVKAFEKY